MADTVRNTPSFSFPEALLKEGRVREQRSRALDVLAAALVAVDPETAVRRFLQRDGDQLRVEGRVYDLRRYRRVLVVGAGKAGAAMARAVEGVLGDRVAAGVVNVKDGYTAPTERVRLVEAGHPIPDERGVAGARQMAELLRDAGPDDLVLCLISGGGSALMELPPEGLALADLQRLTDVLLRSGATINEMNAVRKHLSLIKGGGLARLAHPATVVALILSDVVGNPLDVVASGPTVPDTATYADAVAVLDRRQLWDQVPATIADRLRAGQAGRLPETPKPGDPIFESVQNVVVASNELAALAAVERAEELGFRTLLLSTYVEGEAREVGKVFAAVARELATAGRPLPRPACVVAGGETTVTVRGSGKGGRNQELALSAALALGGLRDVLVVAAATDGTDGPTDAAGALVDGTTVERALALGLDPYAHLADNDAYHFFARLGDLLVTGPTNTNVNDLTFVFAF